MFVRAVQVNGRRFAMRQSKGPGLSPDRAAWPDGREATPLEGAAAGPLGGNLHIRASFPP